MWLEHVEIREVTLPLRSPVHWTAGGVETEVSYVVLLLQDHDGRQGVAEITCRPAWNGLTPALLAHAFRELAWPRIAGLATNAPILPHLSGIREMTGLKALCDNAWRDLCVPMACGSAVRVASVLTRDAPEIMTEAALRVRDETGIDAFKVKLGQGVQRDTAALTALRCALPEAELSGDANSAYRLEDLARLGGMAFEMGLSYLEDPCPLVPDAALGAALANMPVPVLADKEVTDPHSVSAFADRGVTGFAAKPGRIGGTAAMDVARAAQACGGRICNGTYSESALGVAAQLDFAARLEERLAYPHEVDFHRGLAAQIAPLPTIRNGHAIPATGRMVDMLDREALQRHATAGITLAANARKETNHG
ncbi:MAG: hypothetical protein H6851_20340 [Geminicoccaceae bacterium]|nr:hypothetical protein [Geminicoccaceae bacterium]